ncbi:MULTISPECIES: hypothetical protein [Enterobacterales]|uniref:hypothetical protein n=1 Tax=Enterobacteriaceae TaxID=543 RepID=UPI000F815F98|nr:MULTISPECIES: hypothetical protein [Enterobacteriaceae]ELT0935745.1 hypothetical protein [Enterobacter roggenkampii]MBA8085666.1 hypothetical protein [Citrobacter sp. RHBSTW-00089]MCO6016463.1 hypothetical protein [Enterobacter hormaechei]MCR2768812.1 hypothetical protein [Enterobacter kobei]QFQ83746.1 hypothetical protein GIX98_10350 [Enterobacter roggenkampii]
MHLINSPADAFCLPVSPSQQLQLLNELTECTDGSLTAAADLWEETRTQLLYLLPGEEKCLSQELSIYLNHLTCNAEYVIRLNDALFLALTILSDSGQGFYLLFPASATFTGAAELIAIAEPSGY